MSNSCKFSDLLLINCAIEPYLSWSKECIISEILITPTVAGNQNQNPSAQAMAAIKTAGATFRINSAKRYVPVVTLSLNDYQIFRKYKEKIWKNNFLQQM